MNNLLDPTATDKQHVERIEMLAILKTVIDVDAQNGFAYPANEMTDDEGRLTAALLMDYSAQVDLLITNNILTGMDLKGKKRSDFSDLESCVYSHLVDIGRGDIDLGQYFKIK